MSRPTHAKPPNVLTPYWKIAKQKTSPKKSSIISVSQKHPALISSFSSTLNNVEYIESNMTVVLIGHSFIRRIVKSAFPHIGTDINTVSIAQQFAEQLDIDHHFQHVFTLSRSTNLVEHLQDNLLTVTSYCPDTVLIEIGSNDLSHLTSFDPSSCLNLASAVFDFAIELSRTTKSVIIHSIIPRYSRISTTPTIFYKNCTCYNRLLRQFCNTEQTIHFSKLKGFFAQTDHNTSAKPSWTLDGIHCNTAAGKRKYKARLRHSLLFYKSSCIPIRVFCIVCTRLFFSCVLVQCLCLYHLG